MRIVIEGCDGSGKSTLAENLMEVLPSCFELMHMDKPKTGVDLGPMYYEGIEMPDVVWDRFFTSELIYGSTLREEVNLSESDIKNLTMKMINNRFQFIYLDPGIEAVINNHIDSFPGTVEELTSIYNAYRGAFCGGLLEHAAVWNVSEIILRVPVIHIDYTAGYDISLIEQQLRHNEAVFYNARRVV